MQVEITTVRLIPLGPLMKERNLSDRALADLSGIHFTHISRLRTERSRTTPATAKKLLNALGLSDEVIDGVAEGIGSSTSTYTWNDEVADLARTVGEDLKGA